MQDTRRKNKYSTSHVKRAPFLLSPANPLQASRNRPIWSSLKPLMVLIQTLTPRLSPKLKLTNVALAAKPTELPAKKKFPKELIISSKTRTKLEGKQTRVYFFLKTQTKNHSFEPNSPESVQGVKMWEDSHEVRMLKATSSCSADILGHGEKQHNKNIYLFKQRN